MKSLKVLLIVLLVYGCASIAPQGTVLRHENDEGKLLTKQEFMERVSRSATLVHQGMSAISEAVNQYALDNNNDLPSGSSKKVQQLILDGGYLKEWPVAPPFAFTDPIISPFFYAVRYDNLDGVGPPEAVISAPDLKVEVCREFNRHYSDFAPDDTIYDWEAAGKKYPGQKIGRHIKVFTIAWSKLKQPDYCDAIWIMDYKY